MAYAYTDDGNFPLILQLLQQDSEECISAAIGRGKQPEGTETDAQVAFNLFIEELRNAEIFSTDRRMTRSIQNAIQRDSDALLHIQNEERIAKYDHDLSVSLNNGEAEELTLPQGSLPQPLSHGDHDDLIEKMAYIYVNGIDDIESDDDDTTTIGGEPESSAWAASRPVKRVRQKRLCEACGEQNHFAELSRSPCNHEYCRECLSRLFRDAMVDESLFPPRCCRQPIPLEQSQLFLDAGVVREFRQKALEFSTPNRTYCHNARCGAFIPPPANGTYNAIAAVTCRECRERTCTTCKGASHQGDCPNDDRLQQVIQLAREQGWQRCQNCWGMVELNTGCNHMTCRCGFQFCYVCGTRWKNCACEHWEEHRLLERAAQIDARDHVAEAQEAIPPPPPVLVANPQQGLLPAEVPVREVNPAVDDATIRAIQEGRRRAEELARLVEERQLRIQTIAQNLRENHECDHQRWRNRAGPRRCEECHDLMPIFIYECRQCNIMACRRCRHHRL